MCETTDRVHACEREGGQGRRAPHGPWGPDTSSSPRKSSVLTTAWWRKAKGQEQERVSLSVLCLNERGGRGGSRRRCERSKRACLPRFLKSPLQAEPLEGGKQASSFAPPGETPD